MNTVKKDANCSFSKMIIPSSLRALKLIGDHCLMVSSWGAIVWSTCGWSHVLSLSREELQELVYSAALHSAMVVSSSFHGAVFNSPFLLQVRTWSHCCGCPGNSSSLFCIWNPRNVQFELSIERCYDFVFSNDKKATLVPLRKTHMQSILIC